MREGKRIKKRTLANPTARPDAQIEIIRRVLKGEQLGPTGGAFECVASQHHGPVEASTFEGETCPLARRGYSRDRKPGTLQVNSGLMTDERGWPVSVQAFEGNTADPKTLLPQVKKAKDAFGIDNLVMVGDRGMITNVQIGAMKSMDGVDWITALKSGAIAKLVDDKTLQPDLFDERNQMSLTHADQIDPK